MKRTRREAIRLCRKMWKELAKSGSRNKYDSATFNSQSIVWDIGKCTLCQYVSDLTGKHPSGAGVPHSICEDHCPFIWPGGICFTEKALFHEWTVECMEGRKAIAATIASLPVKPYKPYKAEDYE